MSNWTPGTFLLWMAIVIFVPALVIKLTLGRRGGHHLYDKDNLSPDQIRNIPFEILKKRTVWGLKGSAAAILTLLFVLLLYRVRHTLGLPQGMLGISEEKLFLLIGIVLVILLRVVLALRRK